MDRDGEYYMSLDEILDLCDSSKHKYLKKILSIEELILLFDTVNL
jgi:hypothetical protein